MLMVDCHGEMWAPTGTRVSGCHLPRGGRLLAVLLDVGGKCCYRVLPQSPRKRGSSCPGRNHRLLPALAKNEIGHHRGQAPALASLGQCKHWQSLVGLASDLKHWHVFLTRRASRRELLVTFPLSPTEAACCAGGVMPDRESAAPSGKRIMEPRHAPARPMRGGQ